MIEKAAKIVVYWIVGTIALHLIVSTFGGVLAFSLLGTLLMGVTATALVLAG